MLDKAERIEYNSRVKTQLITDLPRSSSGLGRRPFKAEITGSNPVRGTISQSSLAALIILVCQAALLLEG